MSEQSMVSTMEESLSQGSTTGAASERGVSGSMMLIGLCFFMLLGGLTYLLLFSSVVSAEPTEDGIDNGGNGDNGAGPGSDSSPGPRPSPVFPARTRKTDPTTDSISMETPTMTMDGHPTDIQTDFSDAGMTGTAAIPATLAPPAPAPPAPASPAPTTPTPPRQVRLLCTYGVSGVDISMLPTDGVCDFIFYSDVHYNIKQQKIMPTHGKKAFEVLKEAANSYTSTTMGTSMALGTIGGIVASDPSKVKGAIENIFQEKLVHFGMLNIERTDLDFDTIKTGDLRYLSVVDEVLRPKPHPPAYHIAVGMGVTKKEQMQLLALKANEAVVLFPHITIVILRTHVGKGHYPNDTYPAPANLDYVNVFELNFVNLNYTAAILPSLNTITAGGGRFLMISLAMYSRASRMGADFNTKTIIPANKTTLIDYSAACSCSAAQKCFYKRYPRDKDNSTTLELWANRTFVLYEDEKQMKKKAQRRMDLLVPVHTFGLAAYNVEMDDPLGVCGVAYERLAAIKRVVSEFQRP